MSPMKASGILWRDEVKERKIQTTKFRGRGMTVETDACLSQPVVSKQ